MTTFRIRPKGGLEELRVGEYLVVHDRRHRILAIRVDEATENDPALHIFVGDLVTTVELGPAEEVE